VASIFIALLTYTVPIAQIDAVLADHLAWLKAGHEADLLFIGVTRFFALAGDD
jgi:uncharacterized protein YciI